MVSLQYATFLKVHSRLFVSLAQRRTLVKKPELYSVETTSREHSATRVWLWDWTSGKLPICYMEYTPMIFFRGLYFSQMQNLVPDLLWACYVILEKIAQFPLPRRYHLCNRDTSMTLKKKFFTWKVWYTSCDEDYSVPGNCKTDSHSTYSINFLWILQYSIFKSN